MVSPMEPTEGVPTLWTPDQPFAVWMPPPFRRWTTIRACAALETRTMDIGHGADRIARHQCATSLQVARDVHALVQDTDDVEHPGIHASKKDDV
jgi:hypothetical protein